MIYFYLSRTIFINWSLL